MSDTPSSSFPPQDRLFDDLQQERDQQRSLGQQAQALARQTRELERQQARLEQDRKRAEEQQLRSARMAEEQMGRRESQLASEQVKAHQQLAAAEHQVQVADEKLAEAQRLKASADAARQRGWWLLALALPIATAFVWFAWHSNERQAMLERSLASLAADTGQLADDLDESSRARAELLESVRSLKRAESQSALQAQGVQAGNTALESRLTEVEAALKRSEDAAAVQAQAHAAERETLVARIAELEQATEPEETVIQNEPVEEAVPPAPPSSPDNP